MKTVFKIISFALFTLFFSCNEEDNLQPEGQWELSKAEIISPEIDETIVLDQNNPTETISFQWSQAVSSENYAVTYEVVIDTIGSEEFISPILEVSSDNSGRSLNTEVSNQEIDEALSVAGFAAGEIAEVSLAIKATSLSKTTYAVQPINFLRFENETLPSTLFISGTSAENNNELGNAIPLKRLNDASGQPSSVFEAYSRFTSEGSFSLFSAQSLPAIVFGGSDGVLSRNGPGIEVAETGEYRIQVDLENEIYDLIKIDKWSVVGNVISGGWEGDEPLDYQGVGIWRAPLNFIETGSFVFRANDDWNLLLKRVVGTQLSLVLEAEAENQGVSVEDIPSNQIGNQVVTLNLSANNYTFLIELDDSEPEPIDPPNQLFLLSNSEVIQEFSKNGAVFSSPNFIPFQNGVNYSLNSQPDGSGISYAVGGSILGQSTNPDGDMVSGNAILLQGNSEFSVNNDRSLRLNIDFSASQLNWTYYNFKLFHWSEWESRDEFQMTYVHPNQYIITTDLNANFDVKFISPWDFDMGSTTPNAMSGDLINGGGENLTNINSSESYTVTINLSDDYQTGSYIFE